MRGERTVLEKEETGYPEALCLIADPPERLFVVGNPSALGEGIAIVGARNATPYGISGAKRFAGTAAKRGIPLAAICAAPTLLGRWGLLEGRRAICYPGMEAEMGSAQMLTCGAVTDGRVITGRAAGTAFDFALELIRALRGEEAAQKVASGIVYRQEV